MRKQTLRRHVAKLDLTTNFFQKGKNVDNKQIVEILEAALVQIKQDNDARKVPQDLRLTQTQVEALVNELKG